MGFAVGVSAAVDLRILGIASAVPLAEMRRFFPFLWAGFWLNAASGVLLLIGYPTKALTNPVFYLKLTLIAVAMAMLSRIAALAFDHDGLATGSQPEISPKLRMLAIISLACWASAITAGRLLAYTYTRLTQGH
jgi:hypothetical protein